MFRAKRMSGQFAVGLNGSNLSSSSACSTFLGRSYRCGLARYACCCGFWDFLLNWLQFVRILGLGCRILVAVSLSVPRNHVAGAKIRLRRNFRFRGNSAELSMLW